MALVILAIIIDRFTQHLNNKKQPLKQLVPPLKEKKYGIIAAVVVIVAGLVGASILQQQMISKFPFLMWNGIPK